MSVDAIIVSLVHDAGRVALAITQAGAHGGYQDHHGPVPLVDVQ
ncbi:hypothetical protein [Dyella sp.]|nr:hypothetical protein [Dyella sp.]MDR3447763.1 hypothetical protein [Dyella sp.]